MRSIMAGMGARRVETDEENAEDEEDTAPLEIICYSLGYATSSGP